MEFWKKRFFLFSLILFLVQLLIFSQENSNSFEVIEPQMPVVDTQIQKKRPSVALVLGGGGALGFAHLPVLEMIEELDIPVDIILGTSIGAIIGGLYSSGYTAEEVKQVFMTADWVKIFQDSSTSSFERLLGSHSTSSSLFSVKLGTNLALKMGTGLLTGQNAYTMIREMTTKIPSYIDFDTLPIPFRATAVDLLTGELVFCDNGDLAESIRASMSIPAIFEPFKMNNRLYVDGGARENVPILEAKNLGYDIIIAVDISPQLQDSADQFEEVPILALWQMINMPQAAQSEEANSVADLVIMPSLEKYSLMSFEKGKAIYDIGYSEVEKCKEKLIEIRNRIYPDGIIPDNKKGQLLYNQREWLIPTELSVVGAVEDDQKVIFKLFDDDIKGKALSQDVIDNFISEVYNTGNYKRVLTRTKKTGDHCLLELELEPKEAQNGLLLVGGTYAGVFSTDSSSSLTIDTNLQFRGLTGAGSVFSLKISLLNNVKAELVYFQPISSNLFFQVSGEYGIFMGVTSSGFDTWEPSVYRNSKATASFLLGVVFDKKNTLLGGGGVYATNINSDYLKGVAGQANISYAFNSLNSHTFPVKGFYTAISQKYAVPIDPFYENRFIDLTDVDMTFAIPVTHKFSVVGHMFIGSNIVEHLRYMPEYFELFGYTVYDRRFFPHVAGNYLIGLHKGAASLSLQIKPTEALTILGGQLTIAVTGAFGNVCDDYSDFFSKDILWRGSLDAGIQIKDAFSLICRVGVGSSLSRVAPFVSFDFGNIRY